MFSCRLLSPLLLLLFARAFPLSTNIYNINNADEFINFANRVNNGEIFSKTNAYLTNDIDFSSRSVDFVPVGNTNNDGFTGVFDGQGHAIKNLIVNSSSSRYTSLFGFSRGVSITNVVIDNSCLFLRYSSYSSTYNYNDAFVSSIIGECQGGTFRISNTVNMANISYHGFAQIDWIIMGGIIARSNSNCIINNCVNFGSITISSSAGNNIHAGGVVGEIEGKNQHVLIENCINFGIITNNVQKANYPFIGGIAGIIWSNIAVKNCLSTGPLSSVKGSDISYVGSIVGSNGKDEGNYGSNSMISDCFWTDSVGTNNGTNKVIGKTINNGKLNISSTELVEMNKSPIDKLNPDGLRKWVVIHLNGGKIGNSSYDNLILNKEFIPKPIKEGYRFKFWCNDTKCSGTCDPSAMNECSFKELYAEWTNICTVTFLTFDDNNSTINRTFSFGQIIEYPEDIKKTGYTLSGWNTTTATAPEFDIVVSAIWTINNYTITFDFDNGIEPELRSFEYNSLITYPDYPAKEGHTFNGWNNTLKEIPAYNLIIKALWIPNNYTVTFDFNNGTEPETRVFEYNTSVTYPVNPTKEGYSFIKWNNTFEFMPAENLIIKALWLANNYTITFDFDNGIEPETRVFIYNSLITYPDNPTKEGYSFIKWNNTLKEMPAYNLIVKALWIINNYTITFYFDNGIEPEVRSFTYNAVIDYPDNPIKEGHIFNGWNNTIKVMPAHNLTIIALWTNSTSPSNSISIKFDNVNLSDDKIEEIIKEYTDNEFTIVEISRDDEGEIKVIVKFNDVSEATNFVETISASSDKGEHHIKKVDFINGNPVSLSLSFFPSSLVMIMFVCSIFFFVILI